MPPRTNTAKPPNTNGVLPSASAKGPTELADREHDEEDAERQRQFARIDAVVASDRWEGGQHDVGRQHAQRRQARQQYQPTCGQALRCI
jgi:hypothetical protein